MIVERKNEITVTHENMSNIFK